MKAREFTYWLQGYFEINGNADVLDTRQAKQILSKIEKVDMSGGDDVERQAAAYVSFAKGALSSVNYLPEADHAALLKGVTAKMRSDLDSLFKHAIDPSIPGDQAQHHSRHRPGGDRRNDLLC